MKTLLFRGGISRLTLTLLNLFATGELVFRCDDDDEDDDEDLPDDLPPKDDDAELISKRRARQMAARPRREAKNLRTRLKAAEQAREAERAGAQRLRDDYEERLRKVGGLSEAEKRELEELRSFRTDTTVTSGFQAALKGQSLVPVSDKAKDSLGKILKNRIKSGESKIVVKDGGVVEGYEAEAKAILEEFPDLFANHRGAVASDAAAGGGGFAGGSSDMNAMIRNARRK